MKYNLSRTVSLVASVGVVATLAACGGSGSGGSSASGSSASGSGSAAGGDMKIAFVQGVIGDPFYETMKCAAQAKATSLGATLSTQGPQKFDPTLQTPVLQSVVASRPSAIMIAPTDVGAMQRPLQDASSQGIKVALVDTTVNDPSFAITAVSSDNEGGGKAAFDALKQLAPNGGKVMVIDNQPGISTSDARVKGFKEAVATDSKYSYLGVQYAQNDTAKAAQIVNAALQKDPDIVGIFASNTFGGIGAATGIRQAGAQEKVKIVTFDAGPDQVKALREGAVQALIAQQPGQIGEKAVEQIVKSLKGETTEKKIGTGFTIITKANVDTEGKEAIYKATCS